MVLVTVNEPVIVVLPDIVTLPLFIVSAAEAVAAFTELSASNTLPIAGL